MKKDNKNDSILNKVITGIAIHTLTEAIFHTTSFITSLGISKIEISEFDSAYRNINKILYKRSKSQYERFRMPTTNKEHFELIENISYIIKLDKKNWIKVQTSLNSDNKLYNERKLRITFMGKDKYSNREKFLLESLNLTDKDHILVQHLNEIKCNIIPHSFENIVLKPDVRERILKGLINWSSSEKWYNEHQLVHKIGVFLYGNHGSGKTTIVKAISSMFNNAPIITIDQDNVMGSIKDIMKLRQKYNNIIIVLIEDFDMYFTKRDEEENNDEKKKNQSNQNAMFQLLDGMYSTTDTIYIATTNHKEKLDSALIRYGRFDIQEEIGYFDKEMAIKFVELLGYDKSILDELNISYEIQPSMLQSKIMEYRANHIS